MVKYLRQRFFAQIIFIIIIQQIHDGMWVTSVSSEHQSHLSSYRLFLVLGAFGYSMDLGINSPIVANNVLEIKGTLYKNHKIAEKEEGRRIHFFLGENEIKVSRYIKLIRRYVHAFYNES